jgi:aminoglycoside 6'-N-acetyltransferase I
MRRALWPECPDGDHLAEIGAFLDPDDDPSPAPCVSLTSDIMIFVAVREGCGICGFLEASIRPFAEGIEAGPVGYVEGWYVDEVVRRRGIGMALVEAAEAWALSRGCRTMASDAFIDNAVSIEAHARLGYHEVERLVHFAKAL